MSDATAPKEPTLEDADDEVRALLSSMLSDTSKERRYLRDVAAMCHANPERIPKLRAQLDRYRDLGHLPTQQHEKVMARIDEELGVATTVIDRPPSAPIGGAAPPLHVMGGSPANDPHTVDLDLDASGRPGAPTAAAKDSLLGITIGSVLCRRYELRSLLGRGGVGAVYRALDRHRALLGDEDAHVALKLVEAPQTTSSVTGALGREFLNTQRLSHPNVVNVFDAAQENGAWFYTMELLTGRRLSDVLERLRGTLARRYALAVIRDLGAAVAHAHARGVVHADLKPNNIMLTETGELRVLDFGGVHVIRQEPWFSELADEEQLRLATPAYASCEQLEGWTAAPGDDIYALACIAYLLFTGRHPFGGSSALQARTRHLHPARPPGLSAEAWRALRRGLAWTRVERPKDIGAWLLALGTDTAAPTLPPLARLIAAPRALHWPRRLAAAAAILIALGVCAVVVSEQLGMKWRTAMIERLRSVDEPDGDWRAVAPTPPAPPAERGPSLAPGTSANAANRPVAQASAGAGTEAGGSAMPRVGFATDRYVVPAGEAAARIIIRRLGDSDGEVRFRWWTEPGTAKPGLDYATLGTRTEHLAKGAHAITVYVPIIANSLRPPTTQFVVVLSQVSGGQGGAAAHAVVTIDRG